MRHVFEAKKDVVFGLGDRAFDNKKGDRVEVSAAWAERILQTPGLAESFSHIEEIPETPEERARLEKQAMKAGLMEKKKETLVKEAEKLGLDADQNKEPLAEAIAEAKSEKKGDKK